MLMKRNEPVLAAAKARRKNPGCSVIQTAAVRESREICKAAMAVFISFFVFLAACAAAEQFAKSSNTGDTTTFFVESYGNAVLKLSQDKGVSRRISLSHLTETDSSEEETWGKYHIQIETPSGGIYTEEWNKPNADESVCELTLPSAGIYRIQVIPYTAEEMTQAWGWDQFISWTSFPSWKIDGNENCSVTDRLAAKVYVQQVDQNTGAVLSSRTETVYYGSNKVNHGFPPDGYELVSDEYSEILVDSSGRPDVSTITFYYVKEMPKTVNVPVSCYDETGKILLMYEIAVTQSGEVFPREIDGYEPADGPVYLSFGKGVCSPSSISFVYRSAGHGQVVNAVQWDTQFKPGTTGTGTYNDRRYEKLWNVYDDNYATSFDWLIWSEERTDNIPELTAYFRGATISSIGFRNGYVKSEEEYYQFARATRFVIKIYSSEGQFSVNVDIPDNYSQDYRVFSLGGTYNSVNRIEIWLDSFEIDPNADVNHKYVIHISDIQFYD